MASVFIYSETVFQAQTAACQGRCLCLGFIIVIISSNMRLANCTWFVSDSLYWTVLLPPPGEGDTFQVTD